MDISFNDDENKALRGQFAVTFLAAKNSSCYSEIRAAGAANVTSPVEKRGGKYLRSQN